MSVLSNRSIVDTMGKNPIPILESSVSIRERKKQQTASYRLQIDGGRGLVHDEDAGLAQEGPGQAEQLPLAHAEVLPALRHFRICWMSHWQEPLRGRENERSGTDR